MRHMLLLLLFLPSLLGAQTQIFGGPVAWGTSECPEGGNPQNNVCLWEELGLETEAGNPVVFEIEVHHGLSEDVKWRRPICFPLTAKLAYCHYGDPENGEILVSVLDGCKINGYWWVKVAGLTDRWVHVRVSKLFGGAGPTRQEWLKQHGTDFVGVVATEVFPCD